MPNQNDIEVILRRESIASAIINGIGAFMTFFYLNVIDPIPTAERSVKPPDSFASLLFIAIAAVFIFTGLSWGNRYKRIFKKWYLLIKADEIHPADVPEKTKRDLLNFPFYAAGMAVVMWFSASMAAAYFTGSSRVFFSLLLWGGLVSVTLLYFVEAILWRPVIPVFFPDGKLSKVHAFHLPLFWKLFIALFFVGILPPALLARLTWQRVSTLFFVPNHEMLLENLLILEIFILGASVTASIGLVFFITHGITKPIETIRKEIDRVQNNDLDAKVPVTTSDELGYLGEHFNQMTAELRQKEKLHNANTVLREQLAKIQALEAVLREQATRDPLTGLFNRRYMLEALEREILRASRQKTKLSAVMLDLDHLKKINDAYGHMEGGDQALRLLANTLQSQCRSEDTVCRYAGDEFVVILYNTSAEAAFERTLEWKEALLKKPIEIGEHTFKISFSAGVAQYPSHQISVEELLDYTDQALYQAKENGRNQTIIYAHPTEESNELVQ